MIIRTLPAGVLAAALLLTPLLSHAATEAAPAPTSATTPATPADGAPHGWKHWGPHDGGHEHGPHMGGAGEAMWILHELNLSPAQHELIRTLMRTAWARHDAVREEDARDRDALLATPPKDPAYAGLLANAQQHAGARVRERAALWADIYAILTPAQQAQVPGLAQQRAAKRAEHRAHGWHGPEGMQPHGPRNGGGSTSGPI